LDLGAQNRGKLVKSTIKLENGSQEGNLEVQFKMKEIATP
jgi:hypothetical protein